MTSIKESRTAEIRPITIFWQRLFMRAFLCFIYLWVFVFLNSCISTFIYFCARMFISQAVLTSVFIYSGCLDSTGTHSPKYPTSSSEPAEEPPSLCPFNTMYIEKNTLMYFKKNKIKKVQLFQFPNCICWHKGLPQDHQHQLLKLQLCCFVMEFLFAGHTQ